MSNSLFVCQNCASEYPKWQGQCEQCGEWGTLVEESRSPKTKAKSSVKKSKGQRNSILFSEVEAGSGSKARFSTEIGELDRVLGGGLVPGAVILLGGEPGIGKSTLLTQVVLEWVSGERRHSEPASPAGRQSEESPRKNASKLASRPQRSFARAQDDGSVLYLAGEESPQQIALRIERMTEGKKALSKAQKKQLSFVTSTDVDAFIAEIEKIKPSLLIVDSIQTLQTEDLSGASGSVGQIRESTDRIISVAKRLHIPTFLIGHVTKDGLIAGPKILEHMVDSVLELSGERTGQLRILRANKNRFGATDEVGVFQTEGWGLREVSNPSELFLEHSEKQVPGSAVACIMEGTRPLLVEVQALLVKSALAMPRRVGRGIELSRIQVLAAVLQKQLGLPLHNYDIFLSVAGGFKLKEPGVDLALAAAMLSSLKDKKLRKNTVFIGELGLLGEVRSASYLDRRIKEAKRLGYGTVISKKSLSSVKGLGKLLGK